MIKTNTQNEKLLKSIIGEDTHKKIQEYLSEYKKDGGWNNFKNLFNTFWSLDYVEMDIQYSNDLKDKNYVFSIIDPLTNEAVKSYIIRKKWSTEDAVEKTINSLEYTY